VVRRVYKFNSIIVANDESNIRQSIRQRGHVDVLSDSKVAIESCIIFVVEDNVDWGWITSGVSPSDGLASILDPVFTRGRPRN